MPITKNYFVVLPVEGRPYIHGEVPKDDDAYLKTLQELVGGFIEQAPHGYYTVHPVFCENAKWDIARQLLNIKSVRCYGNEDGMRECCPNMGLVITPKYRMPGSRMFHSWGNEVLVVSEKVLELLKVKVEDWKEEDEDTHCVCGHEVRHSNDLCGHGYADGICCVCKECREEDEEGEEDEKHECGPECGDYSENCGRFV